MGHTGLLGFLNRPGPPGAVAGTVRPLRGRLPAPSCGQRTGKLRASELGKMWVQDRRGGTGAASTSHANLGLKGRLEGFGVHRVTGRHDGARPPPEPSAG
ncbi:hypothetical protein MMC12_003569 [Toensbergia leucococca]|nr:hypothetical protein [Toensbergia leucococca]